MSDKRNLKGRRYDTQNVWTFHLYQHFVDMAKYELDMVYRFDLTRNLDGQPLQFMFKDNSTGKYLFNIEAWHTGLLPAAHKYAQKHQPHAQSPSAGTNQTSSVSSSPQQVPVHANSSQHLATHPSTHQPVGGQPSSNQLGGQTTRQSLAGPPSSHSLMTERRSIDRPFPMQQSSGQPLPTQASGFQPIPRQGDEMLRMPASQTASIAWVASP